MGVFNKKKAVTETNFAENINPTPSELVSDDTGSNTIIGKSLKINGQINSKEQVLIEGRVKGKILCESKVIVGSRGNVTADIEANEIIIQGKVKGNVTGYQKVEVKPVGNLKGNIISKGVIIAEGAVFKGNIDMNPERDGKSSAKAGTDKKQ